MVILIKWFGSHLDEVQVEVRSSQVKLGQISKLVFSNKIGVYPIQFLTANSTVVFVFVHDLELPKIAIKNFVVYIFLVFWGNFVTKNWRIASKFGMGMANTGLHVIYSVFVEIL